MVLFLFPDLFVLQSSKRGLKLKPTRYSIENHLYEATKLSSLLRILQLVNLNLI